MAAIDCDGIGAGASQHARIAGRLSGCSASRTVRHGHDPLWRPAARGWRDATESRFCRCRVAYALGALWVALLVAGCSGHRIRNTSSVRYEVSAPLIGRSIRSVAVHAEGYAGWREGLDRAVVERAFGEPGELRSLLDEHATFRDVTPVLTVPAYPLKPSPDARVRQAEIAVARHVAERLRDLGYTGRPWSPAVERDVGDALQRARAEGFDAVLLVRFFAVDKLLAVWSGAEPPPGGEAEPPVRRGLLLVPTFELYDTESRERLYASYGHCWNDLARPRAEQVCRQLFADAGSDLESRAAAKLAGLLERPVGGLPEAASPSTSSAAQAGRNIWPASAPASAFWSPEPWHRLQLDAFSLGLVAARFDAGAALDDPRFGAELSYGLSLTTFYLQYRNLGLELGRIGWLARAGDADVGLLSLGWGGVRYLVRPWQRVAPFLGVHVTTTCVLVGEGADCDRSVTGPTLALGARLETFIPIDLEASYSMASASLQLQLVFHWLGMGTRPYTRAVREVAYW